MCHPPPFVAFLWPWIGEENTHLVEQAALYDCRFFIQKLHCITTDETDILQVSFLQFEHSLAEAGTVPLNP
jgi:hypothetical protein